VDDLCCGYDLLVEDALEAMVVKRIFCLFAKAKVGAGSLRCGLGKTLVTGKRQPYKIPVEQGLVKPLALLAPQPLATPQSVQPQLGLDVV